MGALRESPSGRSNIALLTQYASFFISPFGEKSVTDELNAFLRSHRIVNVEKRLIDGERGTGWVFLVEYGTDGGKNAQNSQTQRVDYREVLNADEYALFDKLRNVRKEIAEKSGIPVYAVFTNDQLAGMVKKTRRCLVIVDRSFFRRHLFCFILNHESGGVNFPKGHWFIGKVRIVQVIVKGFRHGLSPLLGYE